jgi:replicative DNA helicase
MEPARDLPSLADRLPPHDQEAEQAVLGAMMLERDAIARVVNVLGPDDFYFEAHRTIYQGIMALFERGAPVDIQTLGVHLKDLEVLDQIGGMAYLTALYDAVPTAANVEHYGRAVREKATRRGLIKAAEAVKKMAHDTARGTDEVVDEAEATVFSVGQRIISQVFTPLKPLLRQTYDDIEEMAKHHTPASGMSSGFASLDQITSGFQPADLIVVAGRPSMGKTALALNVAAHAAVRERIPVALFSLEMSKEQVALRILCSEARVEQQAVRSGWVEDEDLQRLMRATEVLYDAPVYIDDTASMNVLEMRGKARHLQAMVGGIGLIVVDYLQLMHGHGRVENRTQEISQVARGLKSLAREMHVPILALSQLSRAVEARPVKRPMLSDLRESGSIEAEADVVMFIYRPAYYGPDELRRVDYDPADQTITEVIVAKQRNGPTDTARLAWIGRHIRFEPREEYRAPDYVD